VGTTVYTAVWVVLVVLLKLPEIVVTALPPTPPVSELEEAVGIPQVYVVFTGTVPFIPFVGETAKTPLHIVVLNGVILGFGSTETITENVTPPQLGVAATTL
jgi:hypothetical protein